MKIQIKAMGLLLREHIKDFQVRLRLVFLLVLMTFGCTANGVEPSSQLTAFINVKVVPMTQEIVMEDQVVLIEGDQIVALGAAKDVMIPPGTTIIDGSGAYLMPGLADMHVHIYEESRDEYPVSPFSLYIAKGVTTIRDCGTAPLSPSDTFVLEWRDEILSGEAVGPMIYSSGRTIHGPVVNPGRIVQQRHDNGFDFVKLYMELSVEEFQEAQLAAEELGIYSVGHIPYQVGLDSAISQGLDEIAHIEELSFDFLFYESRPTKLLSMEEWLYHMVGPALDKYDTADGFNSEQFRKLQNERITHVISKLKNYDIPVGTTFAVYEIVHQKLFDLDGFLNREENGYLVPGLVEEILNGQNRHQLVFQALGNDKNIWTWKESLDIFLVEELKAGGIRFISGTDAGSSSIGVVEGYATHDDLQVLVDLGFTPFEALQTATVNANYVVEKTTGVGDFGTIEVGKQADLVMVEGNPLEDITNAERILGVMVRGEWLSEGKLEELVKIKEE